MEPLGILAGGGALPGEVAAAAAAAGRPVFVVGLEGFADPAVLAPWPHEFHRIGAAGHILAALRERGCRELVLIGPVRRPSLLHLRPDAEGVRILARIGRAAFAGDDGLLSAVLRVLAEEGFRVRGAQEFLPATAAPAGLLAGAAPDRLARADIARGVAVVRALGAVDVGQGCVVQQGIVLAVEAAEGTDAMLGRCGPLARPGPGGVLVKLVKPGQERRADLPTLGVETVRAAAAAGLRGLAFEAGGALLAGRAAMVAEAEARGLFLIGIDPDSIGSSTGEQETMDTATTTGLKGRLMHTMLRVGDLDRAVDFYTRLLGMKELRRREVPEGKFTLAFVGYGGEDDHAVLEFTYNWGVEKYELGTSYGHIAIGVSDIKAACEAVRAGGGKVVREPGPVKFGTTVIAFIEDPDGYKVELIEERPGVARPSF